MRRIKFGYIILFLLLTVWQPLLAQSRRTTHLLGFDNRPLRFGFYLGGNIMDYRFSHYPTVYDNPIFTKYPELKTSAELNAYYQKTSYRAEVSPVSPGLTVGGVAKLKLTKGLDMRFTPGISLGRRQMVHSIPVSEQLVGQLEGVDTQDYMTTPSAYIDFPVGFRYKGWRHYNLRPFVYLGATYRRDLENKRISEGIVHVKRNGAYIDIGFGLDTYLEYFRFSGEFRFSYGLTNLIKHDYNSEKVYNTPYYGFVIKELNSNIFTLLLYFE